MTELEFNSKMTLAPALNRSGQYEYYMLSILSYTRHLYCVNVGLHLQRWFHWAHAICLSLPQDGSPWKVLSVVPGLEYDSINVWMWTHERVRYLCTSVLHLWNERFGLDDLLEVSPALKVLAPSVLLCLVFPTVLVRYSVNTSEWLNEEGYNYC